MEVTGIPKNTSTRDDQDFFYLRQVGLEYITSMSKKLWTDFNLHDPGITMLEVLCYAITDLGYRIKMPIPDLLDLRSKKTRDGFPSAKKILPTKPITEGDYRKLFIDVEGVKNAFIRPCKKRKIFTHCSLMDESTAENPKGKLSYAEDLLPDYQKRNEFILKGLNQIYYEPDTDIRELDKDDPERQKRIEDIEARILEVYHSNRNLCEDLEEIGEVGTFEFQVCGDIEIEKNASPLETVVDILFNIQEHVAPSIKRYRLDELLKKGMQPDEIFNGPVLDHGFITDAELEKAGFRSEIRLSDLIKIISEVPGVSKIRKLTMNSCPCIEKNEMGTEDCEPLENDWKICFPKNFEKVIDLCLENSVLNIFKDVIPVNINRAEVKERFRQKFRDYNRSLEVSYDDLPYPAGNFRNDAPYLSIQNDLPALYGVGQNGLPPSFPAERHAKKLQLKAYLTHYDQILATYFGHLKSVRKLFSADLEDTSTYFSDELEDIKDLDKFSFDFDEIGSRTKIFLSELDDYIGRKNNILDHLLARFAENLNENVFLMTDLFGFENQQSGLWLKAKFVQEYPVLGNNRGRAFNLLEGEQGIWNTLNVSGIEKRINRILGIRDSSRRDLTTYYHEVFKDSGKFRWRIKYEKAGLIFTGTRSFDSDGEAETDLWRAVSLAWNRENYRLFSAADDRWQFHLRDEFLETVATHSKKYDSQILAEEAIKGYSEFIFNKVTDEGVYVFENILFRPESGDPEAGKKFIDICVDEDCKQCKPVDPYSFRLTFVLPGWTRRFSNTFFREFVEKTIRTEVPAHILTRICWIGYNPAEKKNVDENPLLKLGDLYKKWLQKKMSSLEDQKNNEFLKPLVDIIHSLETIYPEGRLHDCNKDGDSRDSIILNRSLLGELKNKDNGSE